MAVNPPVPRHFRRNAIPVPRPNAHNYPYTSTIKVGFQNVNGWKSKAKTLQYSFFNLDLDVILIAQTGLKDDDDKERLKMSPYTSYQHNPSGNYYAGVGILVKKKH